MKTAVNYLRYSSDSQTEQSIEGQMHVCQEYAKRNDILIVATYIDRAMTGTNDNRPDFQRMIKDSAKRETRLSKKSYYTTIKWKFTTTVRKQALTITVGAFPLSTNLFACRMYANTKSNIAKYG